MLATKNQAAMVWILVLALSILIAGCTPPGPRALLAGKKLLDAGHYPQAVEKLKIATSLLKTNAQAWNYLGLACHRAGQPAEAEAAYRKALALDQNLAEARFNLGCLWLEQNRPELAAEQFTTYTLQRGHSAEGFLKLGLAQYRLRQSTAAEQNLVKALRLNKHKPEAFNAIGLVELQRNHPREAAQYFSAALKEQADYRPALLNLATVLHRYLNDTAGALQEYRKFLQLKPRTSDWGRVNAVVQALERQPSSPPPSATPKAVSPQPAEPRAVTPTNRPKPHAAETRAAISHATAHKSSPKPETVRAAAPKEATPEPSVVKKTAPAPPAPTVVKLTPEPVLKSAADATPTTAPVKPAVATSAASTVVASSPPPAKRSFFQRLNPFHHKPKAETKVTPLPGDTTELSRPVQPSKYTVPAPVAAEPGARYTYLSPAPPPAGDRAAAERAFAQGEQLQRADRLKEALAAYKQAVQLDPSYFEAQYNLALTAYQSRNYRQSLTAWENALAIQPDSVDARYNFALALKAANYPQDSVKQLEKILAAHPDEVRAHLILGNLYADTFHDTAKARAHFLRVLELDPHHPQSTAIRYWLVANPP